MTIRAARAADAAAIAAIYAPAVLTGTSSFEMAAPDAAEMAARMARVQDRGWPWLVHETMGTVDGYCYAAQFRDRPAYAHSAETSIYVAAAAHRTGIGKALLMALDGVAAAAGFRQLIAVIGDSGNTASIRLHTACGYVHAGQLHQVGEKFGRLLDVVYMQKSL
ncbi:N-acetyltransferase family protein [Sandarakinorhabdus sp.]|uniref:GNAT family N-acetyltransferase n=1 Tax=Sandarakinorhabdus sp. TaxID=1916663 RepID=UPI00286E170E|nr:N-acetyltransferase family protein [Sandarakinorhabdus sp.]